MAKQTTEAAWLGSKRPLFLYHRLRRVRNPICPGFVLSKRKRILIATAVARLYWNDFGAHVKNCRAAVEALETYADRKTSKGHKKALETALLIAGSFLTPWIREQWLQTGPVDADSLMFRAWYFATAGTLLQLHESSSAARHMAKEACSPRTDQAMRTPERLAVLRDLFDPFAREPFEPTWRTDTVNKLAKTVYAEREFSALPVLADALEEAGCTDNRLLGHLREFRPHYRGCWALDRVLGLT